MYDLSDLLEKAIDNKDVGQFREVLDKISSYCENDKEQLSELLSTALAKAAKMTPDEDDDNIPAIFIRYYETMMGTVLCFVL